MSTETKYDPSTDQGQELFDHTVQVKSDKIERQRVVVNNLMRSIDKCDGLEDLKQLQKDLLKAHGGYIMLAEDMMMYLEEQNTDKSKNKLSEIRNLHDTFENVADSVQISLDLRINTVLNDIKTFTNSELLDTARPGKDESLVVHDLSKFLLRKDLMLSRLMKYDDRPENYNTWKVSFKSVVEDIGADEREEIDLLVRWLGKESVRHAMNIRASSSPDPKASLLRLWQRLDERYGSPEMLDAALRKKLEAFPKLAPKDTYLLYELADLTEEIVSHMTNPVYSDLLTYYNTSIGMVPVVSKLPVYLQERWSLKAFEYKKKEGVLYPPFRFLANFIRETSRLKNDPGFVYDTSNSATRNTSSSKLVNAMKTDVQVENVDGVRVNTCYYHNAPGHTLNECRTYKGKPMAVRKKLLRDKGICFKCCESVSHRASDCPNKPKCTVCSGNHATALHVSNYGGEHRQEERQTNNYQRNEHVRSTCTKVCGNEQSLGKSCAKVVRVTVHPKSDPTHKKSMYALIDDQSNRSLAHPDFFEAFMDEDFETIQYSLHSCAGTSELVGRRTVPDSFVVSSVGSQLELPAITECDQLPELRDEIPDPRAAKAYEHLVDIAHFIPEVESDIPVWLLIGRDVPEAHHVLDQRIGRRGEPFAQKLTLGWVLIGEVCLGKVHQPNNVTVIKTNVYNNGRHSLFPSCGNSFVLKDKHDLTNQLLSHDIFAQTQEDDKISASEEDREFMNIMTKQFVKTDSEHWSAPLPFRSDIPKLPNNREQAVSRAISLSRTLKRDPVKLEHFREFIDKMIVNGHAEVAPPVQPSEECWYLPIFGVYQQKRPDTVRVVFDSSAQYGGLSLNSVLLQGPDLTNSMLGVLLRFRGENVGVMVDVEQMFFQFKVHEQDRNFLRFLWFRDGDPCKELIDYRMCVHVFGNSPSPAIATYGLRKCVDRDNVSSEVKDFVKDNFYVDDGVASFPSVEVAVDIVTKTQRALQEGGNLRLHKIVSNKKEVLKVFPREDLAKDLKDCAIGEQDLPRQTSLGLVWNLQNDSFCFKPSNHMQPKTRRGILSTVNSLYDPLGFIAPVVIQGKLILRELTEETTDWDQPLSSTLDRKWQEWFDSLKPLQDFEIPRIYASNLTKRTVVVFSDASEKAIAAVAYMKSVTSDGTCSLGFIMGKVKVAPKTGHTIPRLELCAAVLAVEVGEAIMEHLGFDVKKMTFYTDSRIVLGYLNNRVRRFYVYVQNRVTKILTHTDRKQWNYVNTSENPADEGTRPVAPEQLQDSNWIQGVSFLKDQILESSEEYELVSPELDKEVRPITKCLKTAVAKEKTFGLTRLEKISSWHRLIRVITLIKRKIRSFKARKVGTNTESTDSEINLDSEKFLVRESQQESFGSEIDALRTGKPLPKNSCIRYLKPWLDEDGLLHVGGRLKHAKELPLNVKCPLILHRKHLVSERVAMHYHEQIHHQGWHLTEGAIRSAGFWIVGCKRLIRSLISKCVKCRRLRGKNVSQVMADLPEDRVLPGPPFTSVGVDVFGPWNVITRRTRGNVSSNKRWAVLYTCLTSRAIHLELIEELSTSSFINATKRFIAIRGTVKLLRSDRGTNFVGASKEMGANIINVEDGPVKVFLQDNHITWKFNPPCSSHMGGRMGASYRCGSTYSGCNVNGTYRKTYARGVVDIHG